LAWDGPDPKLADKRKRDISDRSSYGVVSRECRRALRTEVEVNVVTVECKESGDVEGRNTEKERKEKDAEKKDESDAEKKKEMDIEKLKENGAEKKAEKDVKKKCEKRKGKSAG